MRLQPWHLMTFLPLVAVVIVLVVVLARRRSTPPPTQYPVPTLGGPPDRPAPADPIEQVRRLAELRDSGAIGPEEYEARKNRLLGDV